MKNFALAAGELNRSAHLRDQSAALLVSGSAQVLPFWNQKPLSDTTGTPVFLPWSHDIFTECDMTAFLGISPAGAPIFAANVSQLLVEDVEPAQATEDLGAFLDTSQKKTALVPDAVFCDLKATMANMTGLDAEIASTGRAILGWHRSHAFCSACGAPSAADQGGWRRSCASCGTPHFPRTDPVVIMLITDGNQVLLGRSPQFPDRMYSLLAGFVEPGEPIEAAVRREVFEEAGLRVGDVEYVASQPWPFPASLMIGCRGTAVSRELIIDETELEDAVWMSREDVADIMSGARDDILLARKASIAHFLLTKWLADS